MQSRHTFHNKVMDRTSAFYARPSYVGGGGSIYAGSRRQRGGSVFGALKSIVSPVLSGVGQSLKKHAINNAVGLAGDVMGDVFRGRNVTKSLMNRGKQRGIATLKGAFSDVTGMGKTAIARKKKRMKRLNTRRKKQRGSGKRRVGRKRAPRKKPSRKRAASRKRRPSAKRRRLNF